MAINLVLVIISFVLLKLKIYNHLSFSESRVICKTVEGSGDVRNFLVAVFITFSCIEVICSANEFTELKYNLLFKCPVFQKDFFVEKNHFVGHLCTQEMIDNQMIRKLFIDIFF